MSGGTTFTGTRTLLVRYSVAARIVSGPPVTFQVPKAVNSPVNDTVGSIVP
jgi:hypothetical protein